MKATLSGNSSNSILDSDNIIGYKSHSLVSNTDLACKNAKLTKYLKVQAHPAINKVEYFFVFKCLGSVAVAFTPADDCYSMVHNGLNITATKTFFLMNEQ